MILISGMFTFRYESLPAARAIALAMAERTRSEGGCLSYEFSEVLGETARFRLFEEWVDPAALAAHFRTASFASFSRDILSMLSAPPVIHRYDGVSKAPLLVGDAMADIESTTPAHDETLGDVATGFLFENEVVKVWEMRLKPGASSALHRHDHPYLLCVVDGEAVDADPNDRDPYSVPAQKGDVFFVPHGETERAVNRTEQSFHAILIELKGAASIDLRHSHFSRATSL